MFCDEAKHYVCQENSNCLLEGRSIISSSTPEILAFGAKYTTTSSAFPIFSHVHNYSTDWATDHRFDSFQSLLVQDLSWLY